MNQYYIWGAGLRGRRLVDVLGKNHVLGFIDNNTTLQNTIVKGIPVLSFDVYLAKNDSHYIIISPLDANSVHEISNLLHAHNIFHYFSLEGIAPHFFFTYPQTIDLSEIFPANVSSPVFLYGYGLYTALAIEYFRGRKDVQIIWHPQAGVSKTVVETFVRSFGPFAPVPENYSGKIFTMLPELASEVRALFPHAAYVDALTLSAEAMMQSIPILHQFHNCHKGERCFIVATGPSLQIQDLDTLYRHNEISIGVNHIYKAYSQTPWRPNYYLCGDPILIRDFQQELRTLEAGTKFISTYYPPFWDVPHSSNLYPFQVCNYPYVQNCPPFSDDFSKGTYEGFSVTYTCMQFAVYAGFSEIYLIGCDHNYPDAKHSSDNNHFVKDYDGKSKAGHYYKERVELAFLAAKRYADAHGIKIYNATRGGKLEIFERADFDSLFAK